MAITKQKNTLGWHHPDEECQVMEDMTSHVEDKIFDEIIPTFAEELAAATSIDVNDLKNWNESYFNKCIDTRIADKYALMNIYFNEFLVDIFGGAYDRVS